MPIAKIKTILLMRVVSCLFFIESDFLQFFISSDENKW